MEPVTVPAAPQNVSFISAMVASRTPIQEGAGAARRMEASRYATEDGGGNWWTTGGSNPRPLHCERSALPAELVAHFCRSEEHTSELQSRQYLVCRLLLEK